MGIKCGKFIGLSFKNTILKYLFIFSAINALGGVISGQGTVTVLEGTGEVLEGEKAALAVMPQIRERVAQLQAARDQAIRLAQHQACLDQRSRLRKWAGLAGLDGGCPAP